MSSSTGRTPLHSLHEQAGASFTDFAGWRMPVRFTSDLAEHEAVRTAAGLFDLSHMAEFEVRGPAAGEFLDRAFSNRLSAAEVLQAKYSLLLNERGGIVDDTVVYRLGPDRFLVVANAANREAVALALQQRAAGFDVEVQDVSDELALIAVQGPHSLAVLRDVAGLAGLRAAIGDLKYYRAVQGAFNGDPVLVARTGYTGEIGFELYVAARSAPRLWGELLEAGESHGLKRAGLASRDSLRLEAGMPLYGHELGAEILPAQAGLDAIVDLGKPAFVGRDAVAAGPPPGARVLVGMVGEGKRAARSGYTVHGDNGSPVGRISSGALSPTLARPVAMAFVDPECAEAGTNLHVDIRGTKVPFEVVPLPFYRRKRN